MFLSWVKYIIWPLYWLLESSISRSISFLIITSWIYFHLLIKSQASLKVTLPQLTLTHLWPIVSFYSPENTGRPKVFYWFHTVWKISKYGVFSSLYLDTFYAVSGGVKWEHWLEMCYRRFNINIHTISTLFLETLEF